jgi:hypothetical protein
MDGNRLDSLDELVEGADLDVGLDKLNEDIISGAETM